MGESDRPQRLALGLRDFLKAFAASHGARTWRELAGEDAANWKNYVLYALADPDFEALFNLRGVKVGLGLRRAATPLATSTDWELLMIWLNPEWWPRVR